MARNLEPACKQCRRVGEKLFLKGEKCFTPRCPVVRRSYPPGIHGQQASTRLSGFGVQLREKQKARKMYGLMERQFSYLFKRAMSRTGNTGDNLLQLLELRLDNVVYRLGLAPSRAMARQLVRHGHIAVNGKRVDIPSYSVKTNDTIRVFPSSQTKKIFTDFQREQEKHQVPAWLSFDRQQLQGAVVAPPSAEELRQSINPQLIVEYYSR